MPILSKPLRRQLETTVKQAREIAEAAAVEAIQRIGVAPAEAPLHLSDCSKALRRRLRAHGRSLGDQRDDAGKMETARLQDAAAYEIWHRMLFGRFLVERGLLIHPDVGAAITVAELRELAQEEGAADEWALAEKYAAPGLPGVFKPDDPVLALPVAPEFSKRLRALLSALPDDIFEADDSLGWTYQFWRASEKDAVNQAGGKVGAVELPAVTQLFTESYMVKFLLHNTLGAWWAGKVLAGQPDLARDAADENALRDACRLPGVDWEFLRFVREDDGKEPWRPAAGSFPGWPIRAAEITYCDPCCGSGHFLVEAFNILAALRMREEGLPDQGAAVAVLRDNLHGLEIDGRCVQIAAFNVALAAWKLSGGPVLLPSPNIAWVGAPPPMSKPEMAALGNGDKWLRHALEMLHDQFAQAPVLGSLLEIGAKDLLDADLRERSEAALAKLRGAEPERAEGAVAARGLLGAAALLAQKYVLQATNVPFLGRGKQAGQLAEFIDQNYSAAKADLSTATLDRMFKLATMSGTVAAVTPQNWLFLISYKEFRQNLLKICEWNFVSRLGPKGFQTPMWDFNIQLGIISHISPEKGHTMAAIDVSSANKPETKSEELQGRVSTDIVMLNQSDQLSNADAVVVLARNVSTTLIQRGHALSEIADAVHGLAPGDTERVVRCVWEISKVSLPWRLMASRPKISGSFTGKSEVIFDPRTISDTFHIPGFRFDGRRAWGGRGLIVGKVGDLPCTSYDGEIFDDNVHVLLIEDKLLLPAVWTYCTSPNFAMAVRQINQKLAVTTSTIAKIPFDLGFWKDAAAKKYPDGLPKPYSDDPTQWLFHGHPAFAAEGTELHVALARLAGYRWPAETDATMRLADLARERIALASVLHNDDTEALLPLHANGNDKSLADRMRDILAAACGSKLSLAREHALVRAADMRLDTKDAKDAKDAKLETWLAERAFRQHCVLFDQRPFLWHVWDGMKDGFSVFLHYHRLDGSTLDRLTYTLLGDWIRSARGEGNIARLDRAERLQQALSNIIKGEKPLDIFVRWKSLADQPNGWDPDLNDGVRLNIRPFVTAGILREQPKGILWNKDRGTDMASAPWYSLGLSYSGKNGDRINDHHTTLAEKHAARRLVA
jgi:hypothetical protein